MQAQRIDNMFNFTYEKSAEEIVTAATKKAKDIRSKIEDRGIRIQKMKAEYKVTAAVWSDIQTQLRANSKHNERMSYTSNAQTSGGSVQEEVTIGAGTINFLLTEQDYIDAETSQVNKLDTLTRNLQDIRKYAPDGKPYAEKFKLSYDELTYLGF